MREKIILEAKTYRKVCTFYTIDCLDSWLIKVVPEVTSVGIWLLGIQGRMGEHFLFRLL